MRGKVKMKKAAGAKVEIVKELMICDILPVALMAQYLGSFTKI